MTRRLTTGRRKTPGNSCTDTQIQKVQSTYLQHPKIFKLIQISILNGLILNELILIEIILIESILIEFILNDFISI